MRAVALALFVLLAPAFALAAIAADSQVPPKPDHRVTDTAALISNDTSETVEHELRDYEVATGHQVIVWIGDTTGGVPLETFTVDAANAWKVGRKGKDDGAILFIFAKDHKARIEVGYSLESSLTDADAHRIITDDVIPHMKANDPDGAVSSAVSAMLTTISPSYTLSSLPSPSPEPAQSPLGTGIAIAVVVISCLGFAFFIFFIIMRIVGTIRYGYLVLREGSTKAKTDMKHFWFWGSGGFLGGVASSGFSSGGDDDFGGGFSGGGGSFGGGGASGGW
jgi:uncharacterized protein